MRALITGATSGIGKELAYLLARNGIALCLTGRNQIALDQIRDDLKNKVQVDIISCDLSVPEQRDVLIAYIHSKVPDVVINNAGFGTYGRATLYETKSQMEMTEVMVNAVLELTLESAKALMNAKTPGTIMNISSASAFLAMPMLANYAACKAYSKSLSIALDHELSPFGIRVLCSCPGVIRTGFRKVASGGEEKQFASFFEMDAPYSAERIWKQIVKGKRVEIFDWKYRLMNFLMGLIPEPILSKLIISSMKKITPESKL